MTQMNSLLKANEKILWTGKPVRKAFVLPMLGSIPFGLFFFAFSLFWWWGTTGSGAPGFFSLFGLFMAIIGLAIAFGPIGWQLLRYRNTNYMITDKRIITRTGAVGIDTRFVDFDKIQEVYVRIGIFDRLFGTGTLYTITAGFSGFGPPTYGYGYGGMNPFRPSFAGLREPYQVQKLLQEAIENSKVNKD